MARKSIKGYAEKNYYDNTKFSGGIVATNDPLNEGYFKHLVNFDISDTGQSLIPRKGFITTMFKNGEDYWAPSNNSIYFYDEALGKYIFYGYGSDPYIVDFVLGDKYLNAVDIISNVDITDLRGLYGYNLKYMNPIGTNKAIRVKDEYNITCYIIKMSVTLNSGGHDNLYLKLYYNKQDDTLVVSYLDTDQIVNYVDTNYRNLASSKSVIPDPVQEIYPNDNIPIGHYDQFPMIYIQNDDGKYLINEIKDVTSFKVIPNFYLAEDEREDYTWGYMYEIFSTNKDLQYTDKDLVYKSPIYYISTTTAIYNTFREISTLEFQRAWLRHIKVSENVNVSDIYNRDNIISTYKQYIDDVKITLPNTIVPEYVIYLVPYHDTEVPSSGKLINFSNPMSMIDTTSNYVGELLDVPLLGPYGLASLFDDTVIKHYEDTTYTTIHNVLLEQGRGLLNKYGCCYINSNNLPRHSGFDTQLDAANAITESYVEDVNIKYGVYVKSLNDIKTNLYSTDSGGFQDCKESVLTSFIYAWEEPPMTISDFKNTEVYNDIKSNSATVTFKIMTHSTVVTCTKGSDQLDTSQYPIIFNRLFTNMPEYSTSSKRYTLTYTARSFTRNYPNGYIDNTYMYPYQEPREGTYDTLELEVIKQQYKVHAQNPSHIFNSMFVWDDKVCYPILAYDPKTLHTINLHDTSRDPIFQYSNNKLLGSFDTHNYLFGQLLRKKFFDTGVLLNFYLIKLPTLEHLNIIDSYNYDSILAQSPKLMQARQLNKVTYEPTTYIEYLTEEPELIKNAEGMVKYDSMLGSHLVLYTGNKLFISKEGMQYYFFNYNTFDFPEEIVKVIQYKEILLVFTTQDLYAVYLEEVTTEVLNGYNEDGTPKYVQQKSYEFRSQVVLYNLMVDKRYIDAIQVYNQMVLFYSSDGQMFLIKPTAAITSDTRFSIQYFNKSANDILLNYKDYMQRRLQEYGIDDTIEDVDIKVSATLNYIKIFYSAPGLITYILVYDVINNRYYVYDTVSFTNIKYLHYTPIGELYITEHDDIFYFTLPYTNMYDMDNNVDVNCYDYFNPYSINAEIDTGTINLNNHLKKRFKDLHVIYKNLNANSVEFAVETFVDDIPIVTYVSNSFEVRDVNGAKTLTIVESNKVKELIDHTSLLSFIDYTSNKIITHRTNIISRGKTIRVKMNFKSKGRYKIQGFGLIYKEHTV